MIIRKYIFGNLRLYSLDHGPDHGSVRSLVQTERSLDQTGPDWTVNNPNYQENGNI